MSVTVGDTIPCPLLPLLPIVAAAGGSFLLETRTPAEVFTPEDLNEEQRQIAATAAQFAREEILPAAAEIEAKKPGVLAGLLRKAAELGLTSVDIPEEYGGMGMDKVTSTLIADHLSVLASFSTAFRRADWHRDAAAGLVRDRGAEAELPAQAGDRRVDRRLCAFRGKLGLGRDEHSHPGNALGGRRALHAQRRKDVDYQLRHCRPCIRSSPRSMERSSRRF